MRISELSATAGVSVPTIKYYLREHLLFEGRRTSATQAEYGEEHVRRLRVIRALIDSGVSIAETRNVIRSLDDPPSSPHDLLGAAHAAVTPHFGGDIDIAAAEALVARLGWRPGVCDPDVVAGVARALQSLDHAGFEVPDAVMTAYLGAAMRIAEAEIAGVPTDSAEAAVRYVVLGSVLNEPLLLALRRVAEQVASARRFGAAGSEPGSSGTHRRVMKDLSRSVEDGMPVYPGDPGVHIAPALVLDADGVAVSEIRMGSHTGTHVDAPSHTVAGGRTMAHVELEELVGEAIVIRVPSPAEREVFDWSRLNAAGQLPDTLPPIVIIDTGWARWFRDERRLRHPAISADAARELVKRGMRVLAVDTLSPDLTDAAPPDFPVHDVVLGADRLIVENVCGLDDLPARVQVGFFPLRLTGDGAPVRAVAFLPG